MNTITLHMENRADNTAVSNYFIDTLMPQANGEFVKIYLYLLRCVSAGPLRPLPGRLTPAMQTILSCQLPS